MESVLLGIRDLNQEAKALAERSRVLQGEFASTRDLFPSVDCHELQEDCLRLNDKLKKLRENVSELPPPPASQEQLLSLAVSQRRAKARLSVWQREKRVPELMVKDSGLVEAELFQQLRDDVNQLQETLRCVTAERLELEKRLESEEQLLSEFQQMKEKLRQKESSKCQESTSSEESVHVRLLRARDQSQWLNEQMTSFIEENLPQEGEVEGVRSKRKKKIQTTLDSYKSSHTSCHHQSLTNLLLDLVERTLDSSQNPYVPVESVWSPHFQLLIRAGVVQYHPDNPTLMRLTAFHR